MNDKIKLAIAIFLQFIGAFVMVLLLFGVFVYVGTMNIGESCLTSNCPSGILTMSDVLSCSNVRVGLIFSFTAVILTLIIEFNMILWMNRKKNRKKVSRKKT